MSLTVILACRHRPETLIPTANTMLANATEPDTTIMLALDEDDERTQMMVKVAGLHLDHRCKVSVRPREDSRGEKYDRALSEAPAAVYLPTVDHAPIMTRGFDRMVLDAAALFPDGIGVVYSYMANASFPMMQAVTAKWVEKVGYIYSPDYPFWFIDHELDDLARMVNRISYTSILVDTHSMRPRQTIGLRDLRFWCAYFDSQQLYRRRLAHAIIDSPDFLEPEWRKELSRRHHPLIEYRSEWVNQIVRQDAEAIEAMRGGHGSEPDERYLRIKARAEKELLENVAELETLKLQAAAA